MGKLAKKETYPCSAQARVELAGSIDYIEVAFLYTAIKTKVKGG